jgi:hypothetical protein
MRDLSLKAAPDQLLPFDKRLANGSFKRIADLGWESSNA